MGRCYRLKTPPPVCPEQKVVGGSRVGNKKDARTHEEDSAISSPSGIVFPSCHQLASSDRENCTCKWPVDLSWDCMIQGAATRRFARLWESGDMRDGILNEADLIREWRVWCWVLSLCGHRLSLGGLEVLHGVFFDEDVG